MARQSVLIIGAGIAGIATAHYLALRPEIGKITIVDRGRPMAFTSAQSGENYRNWWPHPVMTAFTLEDDAAAWLAGPMPGGIHCKPEGAEVPGYARLLGLARYDDPELIADLESIADRSVL